jgi:hypothetical protein
MTQDILMGNELGEKLRHKYNLFVEKRRKLTYNTLKNKGPFVDANLINQRSSISMIPKEF